MGLNQKRFSDPYQPYELIVETMPLSYCTLGEHQKTSSISFQVRKYHPLQVCNSKVIQLNFTSYNSDCNVRRFSFRVLCSSTRMYLVFSQFFDFMVILILISVGENVLFFLFFPHSIPIPSFGVLSEPLWSSPVCSFCLPYGST